MPPKPFPFAIGVGTDICRVARLVNVANDAVRLNLWAKRVFTRLEWPMVYERLALGLDMAGLDDKQKLSLPSISIPGQDVADRSPQMKKLQFLAGRFAFIPFNIDPNIEYFSYFGIIDGQRKKRQSKHTTIVDFQCLRYLFLLTTSCRRKGYTPSWIR